MRAVVEIVAAAVAPAEGDPGGLLGTGPVPFPAPAMWGWHTRRGLAWALTRDTGWPGEPICVLPLWWGGALVPEGWWRAWLVWTRPAGLNAAPCPVNPSLGHVLALADELLTGPVSRVIRLRHDVEGRLVEVP